MRYRELIVARDPISRLEILFSLRYRELKATGDEARRKAGTRYWNFGRPIAAEAMHHCE